MQLAKISGKLSEGYRIFLKGKDAIPILEAFRDAYEHKKSHPHLIESKDGGLEFALQTAIRNPSENYPMPEGRRKFTKDFEEKFEKAFATVAMDTSTVRDFVHWLNVVRGIKASEMKPAEYAERIKEGLLNYAYRKYHGLSVDPLH